MTNYTSLEVARLVIPLMDFIIRWEYFSEADKELARKCFTKVGFDDQTYFKVKRFIDALDEPEGLTDDH